MFLTVGLASHWRGCTRVARHELLAAVQVSAVLHSAGRRGAAVTYSDISGVVAEGHRLATVKDVERPTPEP